MDETSLIHVNVCAFIALIQHFESLSGLANISCPWDSPEAQNLHVCSCIGICSELRNSKHCCFRFSDVWEKNPSSNEEFVTCTTYIFQEKYYIEELKLYNGGQSISTWTIYVTEYIGKRVV